MLASPYLLHAPSLKTDGIKQSWQFHNNNTRDVVVKLPALFYSFTIVTPSPPSFGEAESYDFTNG